MDHRVAALEPGGDRRGVRQVADHRLAAERHERLGLGARPHEHAHVVAALAQLAGDVAADEPGAAGEEDLHGVGSLAGPVNGCAGS